MVVVARAWARPRAQCVRAPAGCCMALPQTPHPPHARPPRAPLCRVSAMRSRLGTQGGGAKTEAKLDSTIRILSHKEAKLKGELSSQRGSAERHFARAAERASACLRSPACRAPAGSPPSACTHHIQHPPGPLPTPPAVQ